MKSSRVLIALLTVIAVGVTAIAVTLVVILTRDDDTSADRDEDPTTEPALTEPYPLEVLDVDRWHADLVAAGAQLTPGDMQRYYELVADSCDDSLTVMTSAAMVIGNEPEWSRISYEYVCPSSLPQLEQAIAIAETYED